MATDPLAFLDDEIQALKDQGLYFQVRVLQSEQGPEAVIDGKRVVNLASNNYLGLATHPRLRRGGHPGHRASTGSARARCAPSSAP